VEGVGERGGTAAMTGDWLTMEPNEESGESTPDSLPYMIAVMVAASRSVEPRVVTEEVVVLGATAAVRCPCAERSAGGAQHPSPWQAASTSAVESGV
jgi:hypothetical protein